MAAKQDVTAKQEAPALPSNVASVFRRRPVAEGEPEIRMRLAPASMYVSALAGPRGNAPFQCFIVLISAEPRR